VRDEEIRALEREALAGDAGARLRVARAVARTEQLGTVLRRIDLARVPWAAYEAHRALVDTLWIEHFRGLALAVRVPTGSSVSRIQEIAAAPSGELLAWISYGSVKGLYVASGRTGAIVHSEPPPASGLHVARDAVYYNDRRWRRLVWRAGRVEPRDLGSRLPGGFDEVSPEGDLASFVGPGEFGIWRLPGPDESSCVPVLQWAGANVALSVGWRARELVRAAQRPNQVEVVSFAGRVVGEVSLARTDRTRIVCRALGAGVLADKRHGLTLRADGDFELGLLRAKGSLACSLASDGRSLRVHTDRGPKRFAVDLAGRALRAGEPGQSVGGPSFALWHPHADIAFVADRDGRFVLVDPEQGEVAALELSVRPLAWLDDGRALLVRRDGPEVAIEVWR